MNTTAMMRKKLGHFQRVLCNTLFENAFIDRSKDNMERVCKKLGIYELKDEKEIEENLYDLVISGLSSYKPQHDEAVKKEEENDGCLFTQEEPVVKPVKMKKIKIVNIDNVPKSKVVQETKEAPPVLPIVETRQNSVVRVSPPTPTRTNERPKPQIQINDREGVREEEKYFIDLLDHRITIDKTREGFVLEQVNTIYKLQCDIDRYETNIKNGRGDPAHWKMEIKDCEKIIGRNFESFIKEFPLYKKL